MGIVVLTDAGLLYPYQLVFGHPLTSLIWVIRVPIRNSALQTIAQVRATWSTISVAAVLWRNKVDRMGRIFMAVSGSRKHADGHGCQWNQSLGFKLHGGRNLHRAPGG